MLSGGYVYILASSTGRRLYTGVTSDLRLRIQQHKSKLHPNSFSARYNIDRLVYFETCESILQAITRETEIKKFLRVKKIQLIVKSNPTWRDLSESWPNPSATFDPSKLRPSDTF